MAETVTAVNSGSAPSAPSVGSSGPSESAFQAAYDADASPASTTPDASTTTPEAGLPGSEQGSPQGEDRSPFIPRDRFDSVNKRMAAAEAWKQQYGWAESVDRPTFERVAELARVFNGNPVEGLQQLITQIQQDPVHGAALKSLAARALAQRGINVPSADPEPQADLVYQYENGQQVKLYSAEQQAKREAWNQRQWNAKVQEQLNPVTQTLSELQAERQAVQEMQAVQSWRDQTYSDVVTWPGMDAKEAQKEVGDFIATQMNLPEDASPELVSLALNHAYRQVILPKLTSSAQSSLLDSLKTKAAAATGINPGSSAPSSPRPITKFSDLGADAWK